MSVAAVDTIAWGDRLVEVPGRGTMRVYEAPGPAGALVTGVGSGHAGRTSDMGG